ncbi:DNA/RNA non-specific endonuclease [Wenyingzhuangia aestuarii]|uniref:DNA/RNA non-specific endonuclease n=1 Tax=Wenyingzhuangia aestuarii TaxID=1647582 RepID=UPI00143A7F87|nr:DNA/RNA non-specific endonuclease [Wenyingzhuangia aestuarii]NJB83905.1 endonuclease G [Wenyingzhuangia aestuarii]
MKKQHFFLLLLISILIACSVFIKREPTSSINTIKSDGLSFNYKTYQPSTTSTIANKTYYSLEYNETHEQANWVYYLLTAEFVNGTAKRKDNFKSDTSIPTESASLNDYKKSGYDRGHLCPAADMKLNNQAMSETFLMSNMSPQLPSFNRGEWKRLESQVRKWAVEEDSIIVITGPIFKNNIGQIGKNKVTVPGAYYKVLYDLTQPQKMTAFILPHTKEVKAYHNYQTSVNKVEQETGIDFFAILPDELEEQLETNIRW